MEIRKTEILYSDKDIIVCDKPEGTLSEGNGADCMPRILSDMLGGEIYVVHRLDRETGGLMVFARNSESAAALSRQVTEGGFKKGYFAVLTGIPKEKNGSIRSLLYFDRQKNKSFCVERERKGVKEALLDYSVVSVSEERALVKVSLHTGRTHQIRVQFASIGFPLVGDRKYGAPKDEYKGVALMSCELCFCHPQTKEPMRFELAIRDHYPWIF